MSNTSPGTCQRCGGTVTDNDRFCRQCGQPLVESGDISARQQEVEKRAIERIASEARRIEADTRIEIQENIKKWMTLSAFFVGLAFAILAAFGIKEWMSFRNYLEEIKEEVTTNSEEFDREIEQLRNRIQLAGDELDRRMQTSQRQFEKLNEQVDAARQLSKEANEFSRIAADMLQKANTLHLEISDRNVLINDQLRDIKRIQNSLFPITIHYGGNARDRVRILGALQKALEMHGFVLQPEAVFDTTVQATEVAYYQDGSRSQANLVKQAVEDARQSLGEDILGSGEIELRHTDGFARRDIVIKLAVRD